jgi:hypothetical protein
MQQSMGALSLLRPLSAARPSMTKVGRRWTGVTHTALQGSARNLLRSPSPLSAVSAWSYSASEKHKETPRPRFRAPFPIHTKHTTTRKASKNIPAFSNTPWTPASLLPLTGNTPTSDHLPPIGHCIRFVKPRFCPPVINILTHSSGINFSA